MINYRNIFNGSYNYILLSIIIILIVLIIILNKDIKNSINLIGKSILSAGIFITKFHY